MAKDTEKLIRQLSLISYLMAERRPVTATEIRRDVEGYSGMNEDAFARRFYADRAELESLGIHLTVDKPLDGVAEQENYSLRPENFHLPAIAFTDEELASLQFALNLLDGEFAYAEPLRLALQQISWGRPSPLRSPDQGTLALGITGSAGGHELSQRLAKVETAIFRHKTITFDYYTMERDAVGARKVDPYHLLFQGGQFYLLGRSHERKAMRVFRLSRIRGKVAYATKAEHDFKRPADFDPRAYANRAEWQYGDVLNVVNFGGGSYVLYAEVGDDGWVEIDPEPYSDNFARPARLLPVEAKALVAAIDLIGEHLPEGALASAREKIVAALGSDPTEQGLQIAAAGADDSEVARVVSEAIAARRMLRLDYYKANEDEFSERTVEPYALINGREGWYVATFDPAKDALRHFRLDRIKSAEVCKQGYSPRPEVDPAADVEGWPRTGEVEASRTARVWISPERARWAREERSVVQELADGALVVELSYAGEDWLVREVLKEAGDAAVLEPPAAREAVRRAVRKIRVAARA